MRLRFFFKFFLQINTIFGNFLNKNLLRFRKYHIVRNIF